MAEEQTFHRDYVGAYSGDGYTTKSGKTYVVSNSMASTHSICYAGQALQQGKQIDGIFLGEAVCFNSDSFFQGYHPSVEVDNDWQQFLNSNNIPYSSHAENSFAHFVNNRTTINNQGQVVATLNDGVVDNYLSYDVRDIASAINVIREHPEVPIYLNYTDNYGYNQTANINATYFRDVLGLQNPIYAYKCETEHSYQTNRIINDLIPTLEGQSDKADGLLTLLYDQGFSLSSISKNITNGHFNSLSNSGLGVSSDLNAVVDGVNSIVQTISVPNSFQSLPIGESNNNLMNNMNNVQGFFGSMSDMYNNTLFLESGIIYSIASRINDMDANMAQQAMNLNDTMNLAGFDSNLNAMMNTFQKNVVDCSQIPIDSMLFSEDMINAIRTGSISTGDIDTMMHSLKSNMSAYETDAQNTKGQIDALKSLYGNSLKGALWAQMSDQLDLFEVALNEQTSMFEEVEREVESAFNALKDYMNPYDNLDDGQIPVVEGQIETLEAEIESLEGKIEEEKAKGHYSTNLFGISVWVSETDWGKIRSWKSDIKDCRATIDNELKPLLEKLNGLAAAVSTAERKINDALIDGYNSYGTKLQNLFGDVSENAAGFQPYDPKNSNNSKNPNLITLAAGGVAATVFGNVLGEAKRIAGDDTYGYDMGRGNNYYDCSSFVIHCWKNAGVDVDASYTGNMRQGFLDSGQFEWIEGPIDVNNNTVGGQPLQEGDILLYDPPRSGGVIGHTELYAGNGMEVGARGGGDGMKGDLSGKEISLRGLNQDQHGSDYKGVLRYIGNGNGLSGGQITNLVSIENNSTDGKVVNLRATIDSTSNEPTLSSTGGSSIAAGGGGTPNSGATTGSNIGSNSSGTTSNPSSGGIINSKGNTNSGNSSGKSSGGSANPPSSSNSNTNNNYSNNYDNNTDYHNTVIPVVAHQNPPPSTTTTLTQLVSRPSQSVVTNPGNKNGGNIGGNAPPVVEKTENPSSNVIYASLLENKKEIPLVQKTDTIVPISEGKVATNGSNTGKIAAGLAGAIAISVGTYGAKKTRDEKKLKHSEEKDNNF